MRFRAPRYWACGVAAIAVIGFATAFLLGRAGADRYYAAAYLTQAALAGAAFVWFLGFYSMAPRLLRRSYSPGLAAPHFWLTAVGGLMVLLPGLAMGMNGPPLRYTEVAADRLVFWSRIGTAGAMTAALGTVAFLAVVIDMARRPPHRAPQRVDQ